MNINSEWVINYIKNYGTNIIIPSNAEVIEQGSFDYSSLDMEFGEATSALDNETQTKIQHAIDNLKGNYTIIIIAHRLSTIVNCDKIFMLEEGKIIDSGTHKELLSSCKEYKKLCNTELVEE